LVSVRKQSGLKAGTFSPALLVPVATTGTNTPYKLGLMTFFPPVPTSNLVYEHSVYREPPMAGEVVLRVM
jgi:hypothetical protein